MKYGENETYISKLYIQINKEKYILHFQTEVRSPEDIILSYIF